ncbi:DegV family protein [Lysinibacillus antri]|uniref:DegV family protein n=1 Tax=Lysinibacillus antri TaxID=2498145 RepID=A0A3S0QS13_9BACI|nr:DegV family protein [Lysinibacillus antri]RUL56874.1 DegV family protein [Lysinibacillus antri]
MSEKIAWVTDTSALIDETFIKKYNIYIFPINIIFDGVALRETVDISQTEFYNTMRKSKKLPSTSTPIYGEMVQLYQQLKNEGYTCAIAVHPSRLLSNTYESSMNAAKEVGLPLYAIDSKIVSYPMMKMLEKGIHLFQAGVRVEEIVTALELMADRAELTGIPANLTQLHKSGRVPGIAAFIGNLLNLKIIVSFQNGRVGLLEKVRTIKRAKNFVVDYLRQQLELSKIDEVAVIHCNNEADATEWKEELQNLFPSIHFLILPISACIAVHTGEGTIGLSWVRE